MELNKNHKLTFTTKEQPFLLLKEIGSENSLELTQIEWILSKKIYERFSAIFIAQLLQLVNKNNEIFNDIIEATLDIENTVSKLPTKKFDTFNYPPMKGLMKKHFYNQQLSYQKNIDSHFNLSRVGNKKLKNLTDDAIKLGVGSEGFCMKIANELAINSMEHRTQHNLITGEWIIFDEKDNKKYYLTIASHEEKDEQIYERIKAIFDKDFTSLKDKK